MRIAIALCVLAAGSAARAALISDFEDVPLGANGYYNGSDGAGGFASRGIGYSNFYDSSFGFWSGFSASNQTDATTAGFANQYSAAAAGGAGGSQKYGVAYVGSPVITLPAGEQPVSVQITNTAYAYYSMKDGDGFAKKFGGQDGNDPDWLKLTIAGHDAANAVAGSVEVYLADFRPPEHGQDFILNTWANVDLSSLIGARTLSFSMSGSDVGQFGLNTPTYFAIDNLATVPEPGLTVLVLPALALLRRRRA